MEETSLGVIGGQSSVTIAPPFLSPHHCGPATRDLMQSSVRVEVLLCIGGCRVLKQPGHGVS